MITFWSCSIWNVFLTNFKVQKKIIIAKSHTRNRFDLFNFPEGLHPGDKPQWNANSRTQHGRLAHVLIDQTIWQNLWNEALSMIIICFGHNSGHKISPAKCKNCWYSCNHWNQKREWFFTADSGDNHRPFMMNSSGFFSGSPNSFLRPGIFFGILMIYVRFIHKNKILLDFCQKNLEVLCVFLYSVPCIKWNCHG
jgi:hypothetical protein